MKKFYKYVKVEIVPIEDYMQKELSIPVEDHMSQSYRHEIISQLGIKNQMLFLLQEYGFSAKEISNTLNVPMQTLYDMHHKAKEINKNLIKMG